MTENGGIACVGKGGELVFHQKDSTGKVSIFSLKVPEQAKPDTYYQIKDGAPVIFDIFTWDRQRRMQSLLNYK